MKAPSPTASAEEKIAYEMASLGKLLREQDYAGAVIVLGGDRWTLDSWACGEQLTDDMLVHDRSGS